MKFFSGHVPAEPRRACFRTGGVFRLDTGVAAEGTGVFGQRGVEEEFLLG